MTSLENSPHDDYVARFVRQERFTPLGTEGGAKLRASRALICGCGALGTVIAERLVRAGVGTLRIVDRDWVELSNLPRQALFSERDAQEVRPKAIAAADALRAIDSHINIEPVVADLTSDNIRELARDCDVLMDGTDNFETRFLINDYCVSQNVPWVHGGCLGAGGQVMTIVPGTTACFRCLIQEIPPRDSIQTCDSVGVLGPAVGVIASWQAAEAIKILSGNLAAVSQSLLVIDTWNTTCRLVSLDALKSAERQCPTCHQRKFPYLDGTIRTETLVLCGKNAVQVNYANPSEGQMDLQGLSQRLELAGKVIFNGFFLRLTLAEHVITVFRDGRAVVQGTTNETEAKNLLSKTLGG